MLTFRNLNITVGAVFVGLLGASTLTESSIPWFIYSGVVVVWIGVVTTGVTVLDLGFFIPVKSHGLRTGSSIAITFDDGPIAGNTEKVLEILKANNAIAAFFCIGNRVASRGELVKQIHREGHLIGNHTFWHRPGFDLQSLARINEELSSTNKVIYETIGYEPRFFRPPYGVTNPIIAKGIREGNFETIGWSIRSFDTISKDEAALLKRVTSTLKPGDIVLFHEYCDITLRILPAFLEHVRNTGLKIVRVDELLNQHGYATIHMS